MKAELLIRERVVYPDGALAEIVVWRVPKPTPPSRHRFKYSLVYIASGRSVLGYDNERGKGDHRHFGDQRRVVRLLVDRGLAGKVHGGS